MTELVFILDRSGSMGGLESDTIGGFNSMIEKQKKEPGECIVSTILFDDKVEAVHDRVDLQSVQPMTPEQYFVRGTTALLDAVGMTINRIRGEQKKLPKDERPEKTLVVITTDGLENASREYDYDKVKKLIDKRSKKGWEFVFMGANIDAAKEAGRFGITADHAVRYKSDAKGTALNYAVMDSLVSRARMAPSAALSSDWKSVIEEDVKKRGM